MIIYYNQFIKKKPSLITNDRYHFPLVKNVKMLLAEKKAFLDNNFLVHYPEITLGDKPW